MMPQKSDHDERIKIIQKLKENLIVSASAGSGKTTTLVERMVALIESGDFALSKMAALTFTKKAAGEFYERFYKKLQLRTKPGFNKKDHDEYSLLDNPTPDQVTRDEKALKNIDTCFFGTIDAFYQKILNEHPLEAGLSSSVTVVDDDELNDYLIKKFSEEYLRSKDPVIREKAEFFNKHLGTPCFSEFMNLIMSYKDMEIYQIQDKIDSLILNLEMQVKELKKGCKILFDNKDYFRALKKDEPVDANQKSGKAWDYLIEKINFIRSLSNDDYISIGNVLKKIKNLRYNEDKKGLLATCNFQSAFTTPARGGCFDVREDITDTLDKIKFIKTIEFLSLIKDDVYNSMIKDGLLTFSMATDRLLKLLRNDKEYKSTIDQIRRKIDCLLIDECQDTDLKQYEIFFRLAADDYKDDFKELNIPGGKLYACGDRKQGIYHFRGADVSTYDTIKKLFEDKKAAGLPFDIINLTDNHRSNSKLIKYFNKTFDRILAAQDYKHILNDDLNPKDKKFGAFYYATDPDDYEPDNVADLILKMHYEHGYSFRDFMVITSSKDKIIDYSRVLADHSIPSYSEGKIDIHVSPLLDVTINLLKYYGSNKRDLIAYLEILSSPLFGFDITKSIDLKQDYFNELELNETKVIWPSDLLETFASNKVVLKALNCKGIDVLVGLIHLLKEAENNGEISSYDDAINFFKDLQKEDLVFERLSLLANNIDAVQIANVHKTKGLEKKIVILTKANKKSSTPGQIIGDKFYIISRSKKYKNYYIPVLNNPLYKIPPISNYVEAEKDYGDGEERRLLYVAATRAKDYLFVSNPLKQLKNGEIKEDMGKWYPLIENKADVEKISITSKYQIDKNVVEPKDNVISLSVNKDKQFEIVTPSSINTNRYTDEEYESSSLSRDDALTFGTMVHKLLEDIINSKDIVLDDSICEYIAFNYGNISFKDKLLRIKETIYNGGFKQEKCPFSDLLKVAKDCQTSTEVPFSFKDGNKIVNGFIDLILESKDEIMVIDYKTDATEIDHKEQLDCYVKALSKNNPYSKKISSYIYLIAK